MQDLNGNAKVFFEYKALKVDFYKEVMKVDGGRQTKEQAAEVLRAQLVHAMRSGHILAINLGDLNFDFSEYATEGVFPSTKIFDFKNGRKLESYIQWVKEEEKHGMNGVVNGVFQMQKTFTICILKSN